MAPDDNVESDLHPYDAPHPTVFDATSAHTTSAMGKINNSYEGCSMINPHGE